MITIKKLGYDEIKDSEQIRKEMLCEVNNIPEKAIDSHFMYLTNKCFASDDTLTALAYDGDKCVGCATICFIHVLPTYSHPTGLRGHLMNVYVKELYRRQGIARDMVKILIAHAKDRGATYISLDSTESGRALYESLGFAPATETMGLNL